MSNNVKIDATKLTAKELSLLVLQELRGTNEKLNTFEKAFREEQKERYKILEDRVQKLENENERLKPLHTKIAFTYSAGAVAVTMFLQLLINYFIKKF